MTSESKREIRATFYNQSIVVYQAYDPAIGGPAIAKQKLVPPFLYDRMTWIKPSFLWMMYRSDWGTRAGMNQVLQIHILRSAWEAALSEAVSTTHDPTVHPKAQDWKTAHKSARILVQWDPERDIRLGKVPYRSIQIGISPAISKDFATKWITKIVDVTPLAHRIEKLVKQGAWDEAEALLPRVERYPVPNKIAQRLGM